MKSGDFKSALDDLDAVLGEHADHLDALYMAAVCARYLNTFDLAETYLDRLRNVAPEYGRGYQERGYLALARGEANIGHALSAFQMATRCNPSLLASWERQAELHARSGNMAASRSAQAQLSHIRALPRELLAVMNHIHEGRMARAEDLCRAFLKKNPNHVEGMRLLADIGSRLSVLTDADVLLETAIDLAPDNLQLRIDHIQVLRKRQKYEASRQQAEYLYAQDPNSPLFQSLLAIECMHSGDLERSLSLFDQVLETMPNDLSALTSKGHALKTYGRTDDAIAAYRRALTVDPSHGDAWYALANLKTYRFDEAELARMEAASASGDLSFMSQVHVAFALGKAYEDRKAYAKSFKNYASGNDLKRRQSRYTTEQMREEFAAQDRYFTPDMIARQSGKGCEAPDPIFIVGLPRAGSTLIEQILASHSQVDGTLELPNILSLAHRLRGRKIKSDRDRYPRILGELSAEELAALGQDYIDNTQIHRQGAPFFTDKMPNNFRHIGMIHLMLPNAKIIDARRDPMDCCWSGFKQLFAEGQEFTYGLEEIGSYYRAYVDLMAHWDRVLPKGRVLRVQHEDVLDDLEGQVRRILEYCHLPFEDQCLNFHETKRAVRTASSEQVRRPVNRAGQGRWKPFDPYLDPLKDALGPLVDEAG